MASPVQSKTTLVIPKIVVSCSDIPPRITASIQGRDPSLICRRLQITAIPRHMLCKKPKSKRKGIQHLITKIDCYTRISPISEAKLELALQNTLDLARCQSKDFGLIDILTKIGISLINGQQFHPHMDTFFERLAQFPNHQLDAIGVVIRNIIQKLVLQGFAKEAAEFGKIEIMIQDSEDEFEFCPAFELVEFLQEEIYRGHAEEVWPVISFLPETDQPIFASYLCDIGQFKYARELARKFNLMTSITKKTLKKSCIAHLISAI